MKKFSVLMSVYSKDCPVLFDLALDSIVKSTKKPDEVVLVKDGPVTDSLEEKINFYKKYLKLKVVELNKNRGLHHALNFGLKHCSHNLLIRADADDINEKNRFATLLQYSHKYDLVGSYTQEYNDYFKIKQSLRKVPLDAYEIISFAKFRNPFNHQSVLIKKDLILKIGGYPNIKGFEDYALWGKCIKAGLRMRNINNVLVKVNAGNSMIERRGGINYLKNNLKLAIFFKRIGFINNNEFFLFCILRSIFILTPRFLKSFMYEKFMRDVD